ncbi:hypothetical protein [Achromobacter xylosoxidans]|uniref:hypothetical protein n=1 Tax=Alcaligenes xylosoxydans xylosoxydans TaxID=85698 RepID=UPI00292D8AEF|nr:hypothetical protein [Achromobacter xylosoxidans]WOB76272.1 hypothetical protein PZA07_12605 [Achromobacter xylosoxidans]
MNIKLCAVVVALIIAVVASGVFFFGGSTGPTDTIKADQDAKTKAADDRFAPKEVRKSSGTSY